MLRTGNSAGQVMRSCSTCSVHLDANRIEQEKECWSHRVRGLRFLRIMDILCQVQWLIPHHP